jgi:hypothetical protein
MNGKDSEIAEYLRYLLAHERQCTSEVCPTCTMLLSVFEAIRDRLFASPVYQTNGVAARAGGR